MSKGPLEGFRVIDVCRAGVGRWATGILADYGASVISVVEPGYAERATPGLSRTPLQRHNLRSILLNLRVPEAREVFIALTRSANALLESNRPGVVARLGIDYDAIRHVNPSIVYCALSGFGQTGPYAPIPAHDLSFQGVSGVLPQDAAGTPLMPANWVADWHAAHYAAMALLMGLLHQAGTGEGQYIDVSFADATLKVDEGFRDAKMLEGSYPCYNIYETADRRFLTISIQEPWFWERLCRLVGRPDWAPHLRPEESLREEMLAFFRSLLKSRPLHEWLGIFSAEGIPSGPVNRTVRELVEDPQLRARAMIVEFEDPTTGDAIYAAGPSLKFSATPATQWRGPTTLGSESEEILAELGYSGGALDRLRAAGAMGQETL